MTAAAPASTRGRGSARVPLYRCDVLRVQQLTARLRRITIGGDGLRGFAGGRDADERFKLLLPADGEREPRLPALVDGAVDLAADRGLWPHMRTLTVRSFDPVARELAFDLALHPGGVASDWALRTRPGDPVAVVGPRGAYRPPPGVTRHVLAGDHAALPAIATILERLPAGHRARVLVEVEDAADELELSSEAALAVTWLHRDGVPRGEGSRLARAVRDLPPVSLRGAALWAAGEAGTMRAIRRYLRDELGLPRGAFQVSGYWREHLSEDEAIVADQNATQAARAAGQSDAAIEDAGIY